MSSLQTGRSMIEMLGVLAIVGVLSVAGIAGYSKAMERYRMNQTKDMIGEIVQKYQELISIQPKIKVATNPSFVWPENFNGQTCPLGTPLTIDYTTGYQYSLTIRFRNLNQSQCVELADFASTVLTSHIWINPLNKVSMDDSLCKDSEGTNLCQEKTSYTKSQAIAACSGEKNALILVLIYLSIFPHNSA